MDIRNKEHNRYFNEFVFQQTVREVNKFRESDGLSPLTMEEAYSIHSAWEADLKTRVKDVPDGRTHIGMARRADMANAINKCFREAGAVPGPIFTKENLDKKYEVHLDRFRSLTGWGAEAKQKPVLPLSPYDSRLYGRETFMSNDGNMLYALQSDLDVVDDEFFANLDSNLNLFDMRANRRMLYKGDLWSDADRDRQLSELESAPRVPSPPVPEAVRSQTVQAPAGPSAAGYESTIAYPSPEYSVYFDEYLFHQSIQRINADRMQHGDQVITTTQARDLHKQWKESMAALDGQNIEPLTLAQAAANQVLGAENNGPVFDPATPMQNYADMVDEFKARTGWGTNQKNPMLPLSPYDERFAMRSAFLRNGSRLLYLSDREVGGAGAADYLSGPGLTRANDASLCAVETDDKGKDKIRRAGVLTGPDDVSGLSRLMPYMSQREYRAIADWMNLPSLQSAENAMTPAALDRSVAILKHMQEKGWSYKIERDEKPGQIKASINGTKVSVRLTDTRSEEYYTGRTYNDGAIVYYKTTAKLPGSTSTLPYMNPSIEDTLRLVDFTMGEQVFRRDNGRPVGEVRTHQGRGGVSHNSAYHVKEGNFSAVVDTWRGYIDQKSGLSAPPSTQDQVYLFVSNKRSASVTRFNEATKAEAFLSDAVRTARENFSEQVDVAGLIEAARANRENGVDDIPDFSGDKGIRAIQQSYWEVLTGKTENLLRPGYDKDDFTEAAEEARVEMVLGGTPEEIVRNHMSENLDYLIGSYEPDAAGKRFDPVTVSCYMSSAYGNYRNSDDIISALKAVDINPDELKGSDFYNKTVKDKMIKFDPETAVVMADSDNPFIRKMGAVVKRTLSETGCTVGDAAILMDANGIIHYDATRMTGDRYTANKTLANGKQTGSMKQLSGEIGQIFPPDEYGMIQTKFAGSDNYLSVPGYEAHVVPNAPGERKSMEERTRLIGQEQLTARFISEQIRKDVIGSMNVQGTIGTTTSINSVYRQMYDSRHPLDYLEQCEKDGMSKEWVAASIQTEAKRVRYGNEYMDATANAVYQAQAHGGADEDIANDNFQSVYDLVGRQNMGVIGDSSKGYYDAVYTGTARNQGIVRFLVEGASVAPDGSIIKSDDPEDKCALSKMAGEFESFDASDRRMMTCSNLLQASSVAEDVRVAQMTLGGWTFDDAYVVSRHFASENKIRGAGNEYRDLLIGDKISDMHGNKGVISLVVDPDMDPEEAERQGIADIVKLFNKNPELDVVGAPFYGVSRFNAGAPRELMSGEVSDMTMPDGTLKPGAIGSTRMIITHLPVDEKTHIYGEDDVAAGKGRKASAQLAWAMASKGCKNVLHEMYGTNSGSWANARELMITMGLDMSETGQLRTHYVPHKTGEYDPKSHTQATEDRKVFKMPELEMKTVSRAGPNGTRTEKQQLDVTGMKRKFGDIIAQSGGFLEIPFPLQYQTGSDKEQWRVMDPLPDDKRGDPSKPGYAMPILSSYLRSGQEFEDGTSSVHDYTNQYLRIYESALKYRELQDGGKPELAGDDRRKEMEDLQAKAQAEYNKITRDLEARRFSGKHNIFRDDLMSNRMPHSSTAVWTPDPRLKIDQLGMGKEMMESLGVKNGEYVLTWRDPVLRDGGVRYLRVKESVGLTGVSINPAMDKCYDGDFDGDSIGICKLQSKAAQKEAMEKLSVDANLLERASMDPKTGQCGLYLNLGLDIASAGYEKPELKQELSDIAKRVNQFESDGKLSKDELAVKRSEAVEDLSATVNGLFKSAMGTDALSFQSTEDLFKSMEHMVVNGSKGSYGKLADFAHYYGATYERVPADIDPAQPIDMSTLKDTGKTFCTSEDIQHTQTATDIKKDIGIPGKVSQRAIAVLRDSCPEAALEATYPSTQSLLQIKHEPAKGVVTYRTLMGPARDVWRGLKLEETTLPTGEKSWTRVYDEDGKPVQATKAEFVDQYMDVYTSKEGLDVPINRKYVEQIADAMCDKSTGLMLDVESSARDQLSSPLDKMAYGGSFDDLREMARAGVSLTDGDYAKCFLPDSIRRTIALEEETGLVYKGMVKSDTQAGTERRAAPVKGAAVSVPGPRRLPSDIERVEAAMESSKNMDGGDYGG